MNYYTKEAPFYFLKLLYMMPELCLNQLQCISQLLYTVLQKKSYGIYTVMILFPLGFQLYKSQHTCT